MKRFATVRPNDYIMIKIEKYLKMNLDQGRAVVLFYNEMKTMEIDKPMH